MDASELELRLELDSLGECHRSLLTNQRATRKEVDGGGRRFRAAGQNQRASYELGASG